MKLNRCYANVSKSEIKINSLKPVFAFTFSDAKEVKALIQSWDNEEHVIFYTMDTFQFKNQTEYLVTVYE